MTIEEMKKRKREFGYTFFNYIEKKRFTAT